MNKTVQGILFILAGAAVTGICMYFGTVIFPNRHALFGGLSQALSIPLMVVGILTLMRRV